MDWDGKMTGGTEFHKSEIREVTAVGLLTVMVKFRWWRMVSMVMTAVRGPESGGVNEMIFVECGV